MSYLCKAALLLVASIVPSEAYLIPTGFGIQHRPTALFATSGSTSLTTNALTNKEFQLEEREDKDSSLTELWLNPDGSVKIGKSDGPVLQSYQGTWSLGGDGDDKPFRMTLLRTYDGGTHTGTNQAGNFNYAVKREFWGDTEVVGGKYVSVVGQIHGLDEAAGVDCEVGFFSLIDAASEGVEGEK